VEHKDDNDWIKRCTMMEVEGTKPRDVQGRHVGCQGRCEKIRSVPGGCTLSDKMKKEH